MKFIITSGCSYGVLGDVICNINEHHDKFGVENPIIKKYDEVYVVELGYQSQSANYIADSVIYTIDFLEKNYGVTSEDIQVIVEWTEPHRIDIPLSNFISDDLIKKKQKFGIVWGLRHPFRALHSDNRLEKELNQKIDIGFINEINSVTIIKDKIYVVPNHTDDSKVEQHIKQDIIDLRELQNKFPIEFLYNNYIDQILKLQTILETKSIKYKFLSIYNIFSSFVKDKDGVLIDIKESLYESNIPKRIVKNNIKKYNEYKRLSKEESSFITNNFKEIKNKIDKINFDNWWFYKEFGYGGVDEYAMDNFKEMGYFSHNLNNKLSNLSLNEKHVLNFVPTFVNHPDRMVYYFILNEILNHEFFVQINDKWLDSFNKILEEHYIGNHDNDDDCKFMSKSMFYKIFKV